MEARRVLNIINYALRNGLDNIENAFPVFEKAEG
jgi:hypothetical protein